MAWFIVYSEAAGEQRRTPCSSYREGLRRLAADGREENAPVHFQGGCWRYFYWPGQEARLERMP